MYLMTFVTTLHLQASADAVSSGQPGRPVSRGGNGRRYLATKMNITFFMGNEVLNIFSLNNFFEKSNIFGENREKIFGKRDHFLEGIILR